MMNDISKQLTEIVETYIEKLKTVSEEEYAFKPLPNKWSRKEILGHLIDSAQNNIRRFVVAQYEDVPKIVYKQDDWVSIADYQNCLTKNLIELWRLLNNHAAIILANMSEENASKKCETSNAAHTLEWLASDYIKHLLHHLHQILDLEPIAYP
ncbi:MAG TPA: DinB family protein [Puia sp.]|nr:DinB family protein [Puia sp.]